MKITKSKLRRIIQEELNNVLHQEGMFDSIADFVLPDREEIPAEYNPTGREPELDAERTGGMSMQPDPDVDRSMTMGDAAAGEIDDHRRDQEVQQQRYDRQNRPSGASLAMRKRINRLRDSGEIDMPTWRAARRSLYKGKAGQREANRIIQSYRRAKNRSARVRGPDIGGYSDLAMNPDMPQE
tara:strand:+ start:904 stop:1452 length:549 start_codon:yes stop_codon:yes gene_type:complete